MSESEQFYNQIRNTYYYTLESSEGALSPAMDYTTFRLPPFRYPEHQISDRCIFKLTDFFVVSQTDNDRLTQIGSVVAAGDGAMDISGFTLIINGIGLTGQDISTARGGTGPHTSGGTIPGTNQISLFNKFAQFNTLNGGSDAITNAGALTLAGSSDINAYRICSNPAGTDLSVSVLSLDTGNLIANNGNIQFVLKFEIQVIVNNNRV